MPATNETGSPATTPTEWTAASEIPDGTIFESREDGGRWIREGEHYRYIGAKWTAEDLADHAPFIPVED
ncbi:hypothetical protein [Prescottella agglutinans]|uniref:Chitin-binding type-3 domain-containing protein n=1 Tax=Prescottella agglutinans TaxID=1644129 RepID=A0ABT6M5C0_9NOCA|nr:hypothetical protein [Prescottella agglutinans]MDH6279502.1 hypothetical protein [Prescottella agglutinans]